MAGELELYHLSGLFKPKLLMSPEHMPPEPEWAHRYQKQKFRNMREPLMDFAPPGQFKGWQRQEALQNSSHLRFSNSHSCFDIYIELTK